MSNIYSYYTVILYILLRTTNVLQYFSNCPAKNVCHYSTKWYTVQYSTVHFSKGHPDQASISTANYILTWWACCSTKSCNQRHSCSKGYGPFTYVDAWQIEKKKKKKLLSHFPHF